MKLFIAIVLTVTIAFESFLPKMDLHEMEKISHLIEHFKSHRDLHPLSMLDFLWLHYGADTDHEHHHADHHQNLPFKGHHYYVGTFSIMPLPLMAEIKPIILEAPQKGEVYYDQFWLINYVDSIFQPPQQA